MARFINPFIDIGFKRLEQIADVASLSRKERMKYDEGLQKEKTETVKRLAAIGADIGTITTATGLTKTKVKALLK